MSAKSERLILGLNYSGVHDTATALVKPSGEIVSACALERLTRVKQDSRPPDALLRDFPWDQIDTIAVSTDERPWTPDNPGSQLHPVPLIQPRTKLLVHEQAFYDYLESLPKAVRFVCHQASHAASTFWLSGFDEALCLVYDGGMFNSPWFGGLYRASRRDKITPLDRFAASHYAKITSLYSVVTALLGFTPNKHEGKITGLAAYGVPDPRIREILDELFTSRYDQMERIAQWFHGYSKTLPAVLSVNPVRKAEVLAVFEGHSRENIAATLQAMAEEHVIGLLARARDLGWQSEAICLAGGLFANVKINQHVREFGFRQIFVAPPMTDDGTALGAALAVAADQPGFEPERVGHIFLGPEYSAEEIRQKLQQFGLRYTHIPDPQECLAARLSDGAVVAVFQGRMEFGPRALGHRSILCQATDPEINNRLNALLRRTEFMPFAPITCVEDAAECYVGLDGARHTAEFMTITCECTERMRLQSPAVVHVDGTARPQLVRVETNPLIHGILTAYKRRTGIPSLINTSFNVHEEPIVCSPEDAIRGFLETGIDLLYLEGGFLVSFEENLPAAVQSMRDSRSQHSPKEILWAAEHEILARQVADLENAAAERLAGMLARDREIALREDRIARLEAIAAERLAYMVDPKGEIEVRKKRIETLERMAAERLAAIQDRDREIAARKERIAKLEAIATERLAGMQDRDQEIRACEERNAQLQAIAIERLAEMQARDREIAAREERIARLEAIAAERLAGMRDRDREIRAREERNGQLQAVAVERLAGMQDRDREIAAREERIAKLEAIATERLAGMQARDREIAAREERIARLEAIAAERLAEMQARDREIAAREERIARLEAIAAERLAGMRDRDREVAALEERIAMLEAIAAERLAGMRDRDQGIVAREKRLPNSMD